jgi:hypothetical protein
MVHVVPVELWKCPGLYIFLLDAELNAGINNFIALVEPHIGFSQPQTSQHSYWAY